MDIIRILFGEALVSTVFIAYKMSPYWMPILLGIIGVKLFIYYTRSNYLSKVEHVLLEIKVPKEMFKSPLAMEVVLGALYQTGLETTWVDRYIKGQSRPWFSLEMVSVEGNIRFFVWAPIFFKKLVETQIYAQYPEVEVYEVPDYTKHVSYGQEDSDWMMWGTEFKLTKEDPYPIKTYVDYGLADNPKEEQKIDPMASMLEFLGSIGKDEQLWFQIMLRATKKNKKPGKIFSQDTEWKDEAKELVDKLKEEAIGQKKPDEVVPFKPMTKGETDVISAIERSVAKLGFDTGIRGIYLAKKEKYNAINVVGLIGSVRQYSSNTLNGFKPSNTTGLNYMWEDFRGIRVAKKKVTMFNAYIRRSFFHPPYKRKSFVLNTEEIATMYHFPGGVAETPTFERIESKKAEPPANLPI
jgi:hypothetical protein